MDTRFYFKVGLGFGQGFLTGGLAGWLSHSAKRELVIPFVIASEGGVHLYVNWPEAPEGAKK